MIRKETTEAEEALGKRTKAGEVSLEEIGKSGLATHSGGEGGQLQSSARGKEFRILGGEKKIQWAISTITRREK